MQAFEIAVVGCGLIGQRHAALVASSTNADLVAVADPSEAADRCAKTYDVPAFDDLEALLNARLAKAVILATPNHLHFEQAKLCLKAGVPVLVEKPVTSDLSQAKTLVELASKTGTPLLVGHHRAHSAAIACAERAIAKGLIGQPVALSGRTLFFKPADYFAAGGWRQGQGGGPLLINMIHEIGSMRRLFGEIISVQAQASSAIRRQAVEETVVMTLSFTSGVLGSFVLSDAAASPDSWEQTAGEDPAFPNRVDRAAYHITGTQGSLDIPSMQLFSFAPGIEPSWRNPFVAGLLELEKTDPLIRQLDHFVDVAKGRVPPLVSAEDGYRNLAVTMALQDAAKTGAKIEITD